MRIIHFFIKENGIIYCILICDTNLIILINTYILRKLKRHKCISMSLRNYCHKTHKKNLNVSNNTVIRIEHETPYPNQKLRFSKIIIVAISFVYKDPLEVLALKSYFLELL